MAAKKAEAPADDASTSTLSDAAKTLLTSAKTLKDNMSLTPAQEREQTKALFDGASDDVKAELKSAHGGQFGGHHGGPGGFHFTTVSA